MILEGNHVSEDSPFHIVGTRRLEHDFAKYGGQSWMIEMSISRM